ncbi:MAG: hypothetical protein HDS72_04630 [Bacteroidales bacterium]|nr:hypothetical protein [Bacteroidales bacterium]
MKFYKDNYIDEPPDFLQELKDCAWNVVMENPGIDMAEWMDELLSQYPAEVVDALGTDATEVHHALNELWKAECTNLNALKAKLSQYNLNNQTICVTSGLDY